MNFEGIDGTEFPLRGIDEIWEQWNQSNELSSATNLPSSLKFRQQDTSAPSGCTEVFDAEFKCLYEVPSHLVVHTPSARLNITRLVFCRNYKTGEPDSCKMGDNCKFVHADVDIKMLEAFPIHVNYIWRHEDLCTYKRLPPGETVEVLCSDMCTIESLPSERILVTRGALARHDIAEPLIRCRYYDANQTCFSGECCNFIHVMFVDPNVQGYFKRAPKAHVETRAIATSSSLQHQNYSNNSNNNNSSSSSSAGNHVLEGHHGVQGMNSAWVPNVSSPSFESSGITPFALMHTFNGAMPFIPSSMYAQQDAGVINLGGSTSPVAANARPSGQPIPFPYDHTDGSLQELLKMLQVSSHSPSAGARPHEMQASSTGAGRMQSSDASNSNANTLTTQEQLTGALSHVVSLLAQQMAVTRSVTIGSSPLLDDPYSMGTLLFLPRGATEAVAVQPVYDASFMAVVTALGGQQQRPMNPVMQPQTNTVPQPPAAQKGKVQPKSWYPFPLPSGGNGNGAVVSNGVMNGSNSSTGSNAGGTPAVDHYSKSFQQLQQLQNTLRGNGTWMLGV
ncbi:zinc finger protein family memeber [Trypanosoma grayi]|uniref:zinc finger protein family memeber n=1 Tax=Trypanosoma grayi TaxID=71804 RepID=UPI0004F4AAEB|nr:zinc finger protein family memeber [Trypanosoma grayi]KEG07994.1 zinc finger protein family memeber [Trypanosoma grayi]